MAFGESFHDWITACPRSSSLRSCAAFVGAARRGNASRRPIWKWKAAAGQRSALPAGHRQHRRSFLDDRSVQGQHAVHQQGVRAHLGMRLPEPDRAADVLRREHPSARPRRGDRRLSAAKGRHLRHRIPHRAQRRRGALKPRHGFSGAQRLGRNLSRSRCCAGDHREQEPDPHVLYGRYILYGQYIGRFPMEKSHLKLVLPGRRARRSALGSGRARAQRGTARAPGQAGRAKRASLARR